MCAGAAAYGVRRGAAALRHDGGTVRRTLRRIRGTGRARTSTRSSTPGADIRELIKNHERRPERTRRWTGRLCSGQRRLHRSGDPQLFWRTELMENGRRTYHGRRGPAPIVWVIALVVLIAAVVLVVVGLAKHDATPPSMTTPSRPRPTLPTTTPRPRRSPTIPTTPTPPTIPPAPPITPATTLPRPPATSRISTPRGCCNTPPRDTTFRWTAIRAADSRTGSCCW